MESKEQHRLSKHHHNKRRTLTRTNNERHEQGRTTTNNNEQQRTTTNNDERRQTTTNNEDKRQRIAPNSKYNLYRTRPTVVSSRGPIQRLTQSLSRTEISQFVRRFVCPSVSQSVWPSLSLSLLRRTACPTTTTITTTAKQEDHTDLDVCVWLYHTRE